LCYSETVCGIAPRSNQSLLATGLNPENKQGYRGRNPRGQSTKGLYFCRSVQTGLHPLESADIGAAWKKTEILDRWLLKGPFARRNRHKKGHGGNAGGGVAKPVSSQPVLLDLAGQAEQILKNGYCGGLTLNPSKDTYCLNFE
jgi:hypothetical protein